MREVDFNVRIKNLNLMNNIDPNLIIENYSFRLKSQFMLKVLKFLPRKSLKVAYFIMNKNLSIATTDSQNLILILTQLKPRLLILKVK